MAVRTSLTWIKRRFHRAIAKISERRMIPLNHFEFTGTYDESSGRFSLVFGTDLPLDGSELYAAIIDGIRHEFEDYPTFTSQVGLIIQHVQNLEEVFQALLIADDEIDLGDLRTLSA